MKGIVLALALAFGTIAGPVTEAPAASITINENGVTVRDGRHDGYRHHRRYYRDYRRNARHHRRSFYRDHCRVKTVRTYRHHRVVIRNVRVCR